MNYNDLIIKGKEKGKINMINNKYILMIILKHLNAKKLLDMNMGKKS